MHPADAMLYWAKLYPQRLAVILPHMAITYQAMAAAIESASERIQRLELDPTEAVAVFIDEPAKLIAVCFALVRNGISCAPSPQTPPLQLQANRITNIIFSGASDVVLGGRNFHFDDSWFRLNVTSSSIEKMPDNDSSQYGSLIFFTSGSTGVPKKVIMSSQAFVERVNILPVTGEAAHKRVLMLPGLGSVFGFNRTATVQYAGKTACFAYGPEAQLRFVDTFNIDVIVASVQQIMDILKVLDRGSRHRSESLKEVWISGGYASEELVRRIQSSLCRNVLIVYGSSESGFVAAARYDMIAHVPQAVGFVTPDTRIEIVDVEGNPVPTGTEGLVRGRSRFISEVYAALNPEKAKEAGEAWWYPGDLGRLTDDGILCISGRTDEVINMGGVKIAAALLDETVLGYPGIKDAGICAVPGQSGMDEVWIGIVPDREIDVAAFKRWIEESQTDSIRIGEIYFVDQIPRGELGKLQRHELKALLLGIKARILAEA
jgi:long-chain acyl-CoA synthetase